MHIGVLGGGAAGLTAAMRLARKGAKVTLIEKENELGGLASGFKPSGQNGPWLEKFYHHLFRSDKDIQALINELGLGDKMEWYGTTSDRWMTATLYKGKKWKFSPRDILLNYPLSIPSRVRMPAALAFLKFVSSYKRLPKVSADQWMEKWLGREAYNMQFKPVLISKFGDFYKDISLPWFWSRIHDRSFDLGYMRGGFQQLYNRLGEEIEKAGGEILLETAVTRISPVAGGKTRVETDKGQTFDFDAVVSTLPTKLFLRLAEGLPDSYRQKYDWGNALGAHVVILALNKPFIKPIYWLNMNDPGFPFLVAVEHTSMIPPLEYGGKHLIYLGNYLRMDHPYFKQSDEETIAEFLPYLKKLNPTFDESWITDRWVFKAPFAQPVVTQDYEAHIPPLRTPLPNVYMANMFQVYPQDRGQNYSIKLANRIVEMIKVS